MAKVTETHIHIAMRGYLSSKGWQLIAGEFPGGTDHDLSPLNIVDPRVARDQSPDARRHSLGELIPDLIAFQGERLLIIEAKPKFSIADSEKLALLLGPRKPDLLLAIEKFRLERRVSFLPPAKELDILAVLAFSSGEVAPQPKNRESYLRIVNSVEAFFEGYLGGN